MVVNLCLSRGMVGLIEEFLLYPTCKSKIRYHRITVTSQKYVCNFYISVNYMVFLKMQEPVKNIFDDFKGLRLVHEAIVDQFHLEVGAFTVFRYDV